MSMREDVIQKARELAELIRVSPEYICLQATREAVRQEEELNDLLREYEAKQHLIRLLSRAESPDYDRVLAVSRETDELREQYLAHPLVQASAHAEQDYNALMNAVQQELNKLLDADFSSVSGCSGSCAGCSGCSGAE